MILAAERLDTLATIPASRRQKRSAGLLCLVIAVLTAGLLPFAQRSIPPMPGFLALHQAALLTAYGITTYLFFAQYALTRAVPVLVLAASGLYVTATVLLQLLCFPNLLAPTAILGMGSPSLTWLWVFWHLGPPLFALPFAIMEGDGRPRFVASGRVATVGLLTALLTLAAACATGVLATGYVDALPVVANGDSFRPLTTSGVGPALSLLTALALATLCWTTRLRTVLQLWAAVSLCLLLLDNIITDVSAARGTIGWVAGRIGALLAGMTLLTVYLRELDFLRHRAETMARAQEAASAQAQAARDSLELALEATGMADWELDLSRDATRRALRHDQIFGHPQLLPHWGRQDVLDHVVPEDLARAEAAFDTALRGGRLELVCRIHRADDRALRWILLVAKTYYDAHGRPTKMAGCVMDTTERHLTEERLRQADRMEAVGQLTGGVAHDFNNLLTVITGSLELLNRTPEDAGRVERFSSGALVAARRGAALTGKLLAFSRRQVVRPEICNVNRLLQGLLPRLQQTATERVTVALDLDPALEQARIDVSQFEASLTNLLANARDAMPTGGRVTVKTGNVLVDAAGAEKLEIPAGSYLRINVTDTGFGMDAATQRAAFDPFFTTKDVGQGTGLGLSQVYGFSKQAGGTVRLSSTLGRGTTIELLLPRHEARAEVDAPPRTDTLPLRHAAQGEVVLVVEDDPAVLELAIECLHDLGYKTMTAMTAAAALERLRGPERIDLMFSDVVMPGGMNGVQLAGVARTIRDGLKVVLTSGYTASALELDHEIPADTPLLCKPYARAELANTLQAMLAARAAALTPPA